MIESVVSFITQFESCAVAMSAGVDSAVVAKAAFLALGDSAIAVTAESPSLASGELRQAQEVAALIGIEHQTIQTQEFSNPNYVKNQGDRCYFCKTELYQQMQRLVTQVNRRVLLNGTNVDDLGDYRPGLEAASENQVRSPLVECGIDKAGVRRLAQHWGLPVWDKPASPCLSSRVALWGRGDSSETPDDRSGRAVSQDAGRTPVRVRYHGGDLARIEAPLSFPKLTSVQERSAIEEKFREIGFRFTTVDLTGFKSGSLNQLLQIDLSESKA